MRTALNGTLRMRNTRRCTFKEDAPLSRQEDNAEAQRQLKDTIEEAAQKLRPLPAEA